MSGTVLLFGFDSLLTILALEAAVGPLGGEVIPVARGDYNKPLAVLAGMDAEETPGLPYAGGPLALTGSGLVFGWAKPVPVNLRRCRNPEQALWMVSLAGPLSNLVQALIAHARANGMGVEVFAEDGTLYYEAIDARELRDLPLFVDDPLSLPEDVSFLRDVGVHCHITRHGAQPLLGPWLKANRLDGNNFLKLIHVYLVFTRF